MKIFALKVLDPDGAAIVWNSCSKKSSKLKSDTTFKQKKLMLTLNAVSEMNFLSLIAPIFEVQKTWLRNFESKNFYLGGIIMGP